MFISKWHQYDMATKRSDLGIKLNFLGRQKLQPLKMNDFIWRKAKCMNVYVCARECLKEKKNVCITVEVILKMDDLSAVV